MSGSELLHAGQKTQPFEKSEYFTVTLVNIHFLDLRSSGILRSVVWRLFTDVSGQAINSIFKGQEVQTIFNDKEVHVDP
jgi:hypothetical protein